MNRYVEQETTEETEGQGREVLTTEAHEVNEGGRWGEDGFEQEGTERTESSFD